MSDGVRERNRNKAQAFKEARNEEMLKAYGGNAEWCRVPMGDRSECHEAFVDGYWCQVRRVGDMWKWIVWDVDRVQVTRSELLADTFSGGKLQAALFAMRFATLTDDERTEAVKQFTDYGVPYAPKTRKL